MMKFFEADKSWNSILLFWVTARLLKGLSGEQATDRCDKLVAAISWNNLETKVENLTALSGKWVSERCETRAGPEFLLRSYIFMKNNSFKLTQYFYEDESCSVLQYTVNAWGRYRVQGSFPSSTWVLPSTSATDTEFSLDKITFLAQSDQVAESLSTRVNVSCRGFIKEKWKPYREYAVHRTAQISSNSAFGSYRNPKAYNINRPRIFSRNTFGISSEPSSSMRMEDSACIQNLEALFNELLLIRVQTRPLGPLNPRFSRQELLLGDIHSRADNQYHYRPTAFQIPLSRADQVSTHFGTEFFKLCGNRRKASSVVSAQGCEVCQALARVTERSAPQLNAQAKLPVYLGGEWVSGSCESKPLGLFLTRRLQVQANSSRWQAHYRFFSDSACSVPTLTVIASGFYSQGIFPAKMRGASEFDFHIEKAFLTLLDESLVRQLQHDSRCGTPGIWRVGLMQDLAPSKGCIHVGIVVPSTVYESVRLEINSNGMPLLFMGQADTDNLRRSAHDRPTSYQLPLIRCSSELPSYSHFIASPKDLSNQTQPVQISLFLLALSMFLHLLYFPINKFP